MRPERLVAVVGTHTEVGKTWTSQQLLRIWRAKGLRVAARKPVQSFDAGSAHTDAELLAAASAEHVHAVCPADRWYELAMAPPIAADALDRPRIVLAQLIDEINWPAHADVGLVETVGGVLSPLAHDGSSLDLVRLLEPDDVLLVADASLGAINAIRLSMQALMTYRVRILLNRYDASNELHRLNAEWLRQQDSLSIELALDALVLEFGCKQATIQGRL
jgi:dethiobiotin synthetase